MFIVLGREDNVSIVPDLVGLVDTERPTPTDQALFLRGIEDEHFHDLPSVPINDFGSIDSAYSSEYYGFAFGS
jgi:hypothetical protein